MTLLLGRPVRAPEAARRRRQGNYGEAQLNGRRDALRALRRARQRPVHHPVHRHDQVRG